MPVDYRNLGHRIGKFRNDADLSQEQLADAVDLSREYINKIETGNGRPTLDVIINIANALHVSVDDLLVDSLEYPVSTADSELHRLLLDCNKIEEKIITKTALELKKILYGEGI